MQLNYTKLIWSFSILLCYLSTDSLAQKIERAKPKKADQSILTTEKAKPSANKKSKVRSEAERQALINAKKEQAQIDDLAQAEKRALQKQDVTGRIPSLEEAMLGIQRGESYNLKKIINRESENKIPSRVDNPEMRADFNFERLKNPSTGEIPRGIREKELEYVNSSFSGLNNSPVLFGKAPNVLNATPGTQVSPWQARGPYNVGGRTRALAIDINDEDRILAGGVSGGLWESTDQGLTWSRLTPPSLQAGVTDIVQDPRPGFQNIWYYSTGERIGASQSARNGSGFFQGNGIYISTDNAATFSLLPATANPTPELFAGEAEPFDLIFGVDVDPNTGFLYTSTFAGIYRTVDGGVSFEQVLDADFDNFTDLHISPSGVLYATLDSGAPDAGIFRSTDGAAGTWENITDPAFPATFGRTVVYTAPFGRRCFIRICSGYSLSSYRA